MLRDGRKSEVFIIKPWCAAGELFWKMAFGTLYLVEELIFFDKLVATPLKVIRFGPSPPTYLTQIMLPSSPHTEKIRLTHALT